MLVQTPPSLFCCFLAVQAALGCAVGAFFPMLLWAADAGAFGSLLRGADAATLFIVIVSSMVTFCPLVLATAIGLLADDDR
jgi:hypothetical protein